MCIVAAKFGKPLPPLIGGLIGMVSRVAKLWLPRHERNEAGLLIAITSENHPDGSLPFSLGDLILHIFDGVKC